MLSQKQTSAALFTLCLGTFLALLGFSVISSFVVAFVIGILLLGIAYVKRSLISATRVIDSESNCSVTVKRNEQKSIIQEPSFLGKAHVTPTKNLPSGSTPSVQDVKQTLNFTKSANSSISTPVKVLNSSVIKLKNAHYGGGTWPLNSTPIEKKSILVEQNYHMMKAINNVQQASPYSVKRSAVEKESPPPVSLHKKPKMQPIHKEGRALRHVPTVYVVHKKAENVLKNKGNKRVLENNENVNDPKRRNKEDDEISNDKPQKRKLLSIVHITGKKHKVPSINSPTKYSRSTDLVVTNDDLKEDRRRNEERVRKLLAHKDDHEDNAKLSIKPAKKQPISDIDTNLNIINKPETSKSIITNDKENFVPVNQSVNANPTVADSNLQPASAETPKSLPKTSVALDTSLVSADSKVVKSLFSNSEVEAPESPKTAFSFGSSIIKSEPTSQSIASTTDTKPILSVGLNTALSLGTKTSDVSKVTPAFSFSGINTGATLVENNPSTTKPASSLVVPALSVDTPSFSFTSQTTSHSIPSSSAPLFSSGATSTATFSMPTTKTLETKAAIGFSDKPNSVSEGADTKPAFSFGPASSSSTNKLAGFSFGGNPVPSSVTSTVSTPNTTFSFGSSSTISAAPSVAAAKNISFCTTSLPSSLLQVAPTISSTSSAPSTGFSFGNNNSINSAPATALSFGSLTANPSSTSNLFASSTLSTATSSSTFGSNVSATPSSGFSFGAAPASTSGFGVNAHSSTTGSGFSFEGTATASAVVKPNNVTAVNSGFGSSTTFGSSTSSGTSTFCAASSSTPAFGSSGSIFGGSSGPSANSLSTPVVVSTDSISLFGSSAPANINSAETGAFHPPAVSSFGFGTSTNSNTEPKTTGFSFGSNSSSSTSAPAPGGFSFGANTPKTESGFNFGTTPVTNLATAPANSGFNFGGNTPSAAPPSDSPIASNLFSSPTSATPARRIATPRRRKPR